MNTTQPFESSVALAYSRLFDILSSLYLHRPTEEMVEAFNTIAATEGFGIDIEIPPAQETIAELIADYDELFLVPVSGRYLPPFESAQRAQRLWGPLTHQMANLYRKTGFEPNALNIDEMWQSLNAPDHIGIELAFCSALFSTYAENPSTATETLIHTVMQQHITRWIPGFGEKLRQHAQTSLYRSLGMLTVSMGTVGVFQNR